MAERVADADLKEMEEKRAAYRAKQVKEKIRVKAFAKERRELEERLKKRKEDAEAARKAEAKIVKAAAVQAAKDPQPFWPELTELLVHLEAGLPKCAATVLKDKGRLTAGQKKTLDEALGKARMAIAVFRTKSMN
jgi:tryptophan 2,3-dioxygenase